MDEYFYEEDPEVNRRAYMLMFKDLFNFIAMILGVSVACLFVLFLTTKA